MSGSIICTSCRKLISSAEKACPYCGAAAPGAMAGPARFALSLRSGLLRGRVQPSVIIWWATCALYLLSLAIDPSNLLKLDQGGVGALMSVGSPSGKAMYLLGMTGGLAWACGHLWTMLTASFLHGGLLHIVFNLQWLRTLGPAAEEMFGPARFVVLYLLTGVGGFLTSNLWSGVPTIGASCSLFGLMGALIAYGRRRGGAFGQALSQQVIAWVIVGLALGFVMPVVNNAGHIGGFVSGLALGYVLPIEGRAEGRGVAFLALGLAVMTAAGVGLSLWKMWLPVTADMPFCF